MNFTGIDLSLNATGFVTIDKERLVIKEEIITSNPKEEIEDRIIHIRSEISKLIIEESIYYIEGLSYMSVSATMAQLAALHYAIRIYLREIHIPFKIIPPTSLKKFVTGKGNSKKSLMIKNVYKKFGYDTEDDNLADAYGLAMMAFKSNCEN
jgi:crossover junction endodeoxyribonuclease RuvC